MRADSIGKLKLQCLAIAFAILGMSLSACSYKQTRADIEAQAEWDRFALEAPGGG